MHPAGDVTLADEGCKWPVARFSPIAGLWRISDSFEAARTRIDRFIGDVLDMRHLMAALVTLVLIGCAATAPPEVTAEGRCGALPGWEALAEASTGRIVLVGEIHGTKEMPDAFYRYLCHLAEAGEPVLVALEIEEYDNAALQAGFLSDAPEAVWSRDLFVFNRASDGRGSVAMMGLLLRLKALQEAGFPVEVRAVAGPNRADRDARIEALSARQSRRFGYEARNLLAAAAEAPLARVVYYGGNLHARNIGLQRDHDGALFDADRFIRIIALSDAAATRPCQYGDMDPVMATNCDGARHPSFRPASAPAIGLDNPLVHPFWQQIDGYLYVGEETPSPLWRHQQGK